MLNSHFGRRLVRSNGKDSSASHGLSVEPAAPDAAMLSRVNWMTHRIGSMPELGQYAAIALALPGGSLIAFSLWAFRHRAQLAPHARRALAVAVALGAGLLVRSAS